MRRIEFGIEIICASSSSAPGCLLVRGHTDLLAKKDSGVDEFAGGQTPEGALRSICDTCRSPIHERSVYAIERVSETYQRGEYPPRGNLGDLA
jgi:hypothetical protein